jgi:uncharacterized protein
VSRPSLQESAALARLADDYFESAERRDWPRLAGLYCEDAVFWHNSDQREQPHTENTAMLVALSPHFRTFSYLNVRRRFFRGGFVQQHNLRVETQDAEVFIMRCCMVVQVRDGRIARVDEYLDSRQLPPAGHAAVGGGPA